VRLLRECSAQIGLKRSVTIYYSTTLKVPVTWGTWGPVLLLPANADHWSAARRRLVLLHELSHIKRGDCLTQTLGIVASACYWFNPLVWLAARRMRVERELACDDLVLRTGARPSEYASELLSFASEIKHNSLLTWAAVPMARPSSLEARLRAILDGNRNRASVSRALGIATSVLLISVLVPVAMLRAAPSASSTAARSPGAPGGEGNLPSTIGSARSARSRVTDLGYTFDKTFEREMLVTDSRYLDLDTGEFVQIAPPGDLFHSVIESDLRVRAGLNLAAISVPPSRWEAAAAEVARELGGVPQQKEIRLGGESDRTWFFKTGRERMGILQISPVERRPGSVLVRFKHVRPRRQFAPVQLMLLRWETEPRFLDLDTGRIGTALPTNSPAAYLEKSERWGWQLVVEPFHNYHTEKLRARALWESVDAEPIGEPPGLAALPMERKGIYDLRAEALPSTILIPGWGLLYVEGMDQRNPEQPAVLLKSKRVIAPVQGGGRVAEILAAIASRVAQIQAAAANHQLLDRAEIFDQLNEYCDQLQGKNQNPAPAMSEWGVRDAAQFREIMELIAGLENDAEGLRSVAQSRTGGTERLSLANQVWETGFLKKYARLKALLLPARTQPDVG
jgi:hypothetical protein